MNNEHLLSTCCKANIKFATVNNSDWFAVCSKCQKEAEIYRPDNKQLANATPQSKEIEEITNPESDFWQFQTVCDDNDNFACEHRLQIIKDFILSYAKAQREETIREVIEVIPDGANTDIKWEEGEWMQYRSLHNLKAELVKFLNSLNNK